MKNLGIADVILGMEITRTSKGLILSQSHYVDKIIEKFNKDDSTIAKTLLEANLHLIKNRGECIS